MKYAHTHLTKLALSLLSLATAASLSACGGGGSTPGPSASPQPDVITPPAPTYLSAATSATSTPTYSGAMAGELNDAFTRLNQLRTNAGLGVLNSSPAMITAAQNHANYLALNMTFNSDLHIETQGLSGYTGTTPSARLGAAGFSVANSSEVDEDLASGLAVDTVEALVSMPFHRSGLMAHQNTHVGIASTNNGGTRGNFTVIKSTAQSGLQEMTTPDQISVYPTDGQSNIPTSQPPETPNPVPEIGSWCNPTCPGYTVSIQTRRRTTLTVTSFTLTDSNGQTATTKLLDKNDTIYHTRRGLTNWAHIVPLTALTPSTTYTAQFQGTITENGQTRSITKTWSFTTKANTLTINAPRYLPDGTVWVSADSAAGVVRTTYGYLTPSNCGSQFAFTTSAGATGLYFRITQAPTPGCQLNVSFRDPATGAQAAANINMTQ